MVAASATSRHPGALTLANVSSSSNQAVPSFRANWQSLVSTPKAKVEEDDKGGNAVRTVFGKGKSAAQFLGDASSAAPMARMTQQPSAQAMKLASVAHPNKGPGAEPSSTLYDPLIMTASPATQSSSESATGRSKGTNDERSVAQFRNKERISEQSVANAATDPTAILPLPVLRFVANVAAPAHFPSADLPNNTSATASSAMLAFGQPSELNLNDKGRTDTDLSHSIDRMTGKDAKENEDSARIPSHSASAGNGTELHPINDQDKTSTEKADATAAQFAGEQQWSRTENNPPANPSQEAAESTVHTSQASPIAVPTPLPGPESAALADDSFTAQPNQLQPASPVDPTFETKRVSDPAASRSTRGTVSREPGQRSRSVSAQACENAGEGLATLTDPGATRSIAHQSEANPRIRAGASVESGVSKTFESLDTGVTVRTPTWIRASAQLAEAGFQDPTLGWVGVRAKVDLNGIHATVIPNSTDAAQELGGHLEGMNSYLAARNTSVESVTLAEPEHHSLHSGADAQAHHGMNQGEHQQSDNGKDGEPLPGKGIRNGNTRSISQSLNVATQPTQTGVAGRGIESFKGSGAHVSVIA